MGLGQVLVCTVWTLVPQGILAKLQAFEITLSIGPKVVPFWGSYLDFYKVLPKRNYFGAYG